MPQKGHITRKQESNGLKAGDTITFNGDIMDINGRIDHPKGSNGAVEYIDVIEGFYSNLCPDIWIPERINAIKLVGVYGHWMTNAFFETQHMKR